VQVYNAKNMTLIAEREVVAGQIVGCRLKCLFHNVGKYKQLPTFWNIDVPLMVCDADSVNGCLLK